MSAATMNGDSTSRKQQQPQKSVWNTFNPKTNNAPNGTDKPLSKPPHQAPQMKSSSEALDKQAHDRSLFLMAHFVGNDATITLKNGEQYTGVFSGGSFEANKALYVIKMAKQTRTAGGQQQANGNSDLSGGYLGEGEEHIMSFDVQDTTDLYVQDVTTFTAQHRQNGAAASSFMTDTQISGRDPHMPRARELQRWDAGHESSIDMSLGDPNDSSWDQFAANERMYGVQSTYDEDIYTTSINRQNPEYKRRQAEADRIAREIEGSAPANAHVAEERRRDANRDDGGDEEDKYSGVRREATTLPKRATGAYVPPSQRPMTGAPSVPGVPFDPAIISSQIKASPAQTSQAQAPVPRVSTEISPDSGVAPKKKETTTEDRVRDTADAFKQFANNEKLRVRAAQEAKRTTARQEKNVKLNDLKKFAANFKLKSRVPDDLVPILAKDREKQLEIQSKAEEAAKEEESRDKTNSAVTSPIPSNTTSQPGPPPSTGPRVDLNQQQRQRPQAGRGGPAPGQQGQGPAQLPRAPLGQRIQGNFNARAGMPQPLPADLRIPAGPPPAATEQPMSPGSATRLNVNAKAFEFRPGAFAFTPTGSSPSPQRAVSRGRQPAEQKASFFSKGKPKTTKPFPSTFDPLHRMAEADYNDQEKKKYTQNGGLPQAYNTNPTWPVTKPNDGAMYLAAFPKTQAPSQGPSPMHTPIPNNQMPHAHQLPAHMHGNMQQPSHRQQQFYPQQQHGPTFDPRLQQQFGPNGSVQNSPRAQQIPVAPFSGQMPPMPQGFPGQPMPQGYGVSPSMAYRQPHMQSGPMMMMPGQPQGQMGQMRPGGYGPGPQFNGPLMGGHMMVQQHSGGYANGPMPQQGFSPMPPHAQPHMPHMQQHGGQNFNNGPRPPMMSHQGSHQGFQPNMQMQGQFQPSPNQAHPYHLQQQRAMSGGFPQMTPRQQHAIPNHPSPGMGGVPGQGDEGK
ncbi:uncharacterized protein MYCGRDRAFT_111497 [Zymoseptoria tritici IPO323]|uniref:LsmAD domain-containing protein n=1 Tax=Zymoseptoria tritici (strain CBS 115943 / IPO323) TaxID=336722 RepID=F9XNV0_ZYMTI|nr:uncharacterized protein MYCGRDRAFT_111497 [Zymoseptoria tritici IPO323]EGP83104.1 hypothetical protein MYCGRDRAFT_111497 [Zymoseptoria tritici IPO323]